MNDGILASAGVEVQYNIGSSSSVTTSDLADLWGQAASSSRSPDAGTVRGPV